MARRERTTGLPRARQREVAAHAGRRPVNERAVRIGLFGALGALLLAVIGLLAYQIYDARIARSGTTILRVGETTYSLGYYADRLGPWVQANLNSGSSLAILQESLLRKLEDEAITVQLAEEQGIDLSDTALLAFIAEGFGVPVGGSGSTFESLYRNQLRVLHMDDGSYRRLRRAELANTRLAEAVNATVPETGDLYTVRVILLRDEDAATAIAARVEAGEDMGAIAQAESLDLESRQDDGILPAEPFDLFPEAVRTVMEGAEPGALLGPVQVSASWWVFRIEAVQEGEFSDTQREQLGGNLLIERIDAKRAELAGQVRRSLDADDAEWALEHATIPETE